MKSKKLQVVNGEYLCDIDISTKEWIKILQDKELMTNNYRETLLKFYNEPEHKSTCKFIGQKYNESPFSVNAKILNFAKAVQKKLNRFKVIDADGNSVYWIIPMKGKTIAGGLFEWTLRKELVEAMKESFITHKRAPQSTSTLQYINLLETSKNLIFTGAPGTGKTYLAKEIAKQMIGIQNDEELKNSEQFDFVQFHPSYDYTDFVEGLRPTKPDENGNIGFELKDGVFKSFCKKAKNDRNLVSSNNFDKAWDKLINDVRNNLANGVLTRIGNWDYGLSKNDSLKYSSNNTPSQYSFTITKKNVYDTYLGNPARPSGAFHKDMGDIVKYLKETYKLNDFYEKEIKSTENKKYIFLIDEINRGEISKIFGELFFSIDPSYRGIKGAVKTQYSNLHENENEMFYIPENVYIIGTMNDIDRSVESFDFAMRRRFVWQEITAEQSAENMRLPEETKERMKSLNNAISKIEGLNSSYHIGGAYFLDKDGKENIDYGNLWTLRLEPLLKEYLRGLPDSEEKLLSLKSAFNLEDQSENDGQ